MHKKIVGRVRNLFCVGWVPQSSIGLISAEIGALFLILGHAIQHVQNQPSSVSGVSDILFGHVTFPFLSIVICGELSTFPVHFTSVVIWAFPDSTIIGCFS